MFQFFSVLEEVVWGVILATYFGTSFLLWVFDRFSPFSYQNNIEKFEDDDETSVLIFSSMRSAEKENYV